MSKYAMPKEADLDEVFVTWNGQKRTTGEWLRFYEGERIPNEVPGPIPGVPLYVYDDFNLRTAPPEAFLAESERRMALARKVALEGTSLAGRELQAANVITLMNQAFGLYGYGVVLGGVGPSADRLLVWLADAQEAMRMLAHIVRVALAWAETQGVQLGIEIEAEQRNLVGFLKSLSASVGQAINKLVGPQGGMSAAMWAVVGGVGTLAAALVVKAVAR